MVLHSLIYKTKTINAHAVNWAKNCNNKLQQQIPEFNQLFHKRNIKNSDILLATHFCNVLLARMVIEEI